ncbi:MAG: hypothetical protein JWO92_20 [Chitinophagaceae bacterium]|nr:hypothetical protein [Chitinophagaceae bacterium]
MRIKKLFVIFLISFSFTYQAVAQRNPYSEVSIASPTAASLGKYADIPVSNHTGIPNISIPIYTIKEGPLEFPISLSYHAGGLKVMESASWVGAGWSLNAGGVITRTVQGAPDEKYTSTVDDQFAGYFSDYGYHNYETGSCTVTNPSGSNSGYFCGAEFEQGKKDGEPDLFFFNFGGYSGKFYFNDDRTPVLVNNEDIKIQYNYAQGSGSIKSFILTTPDGVRYLFGKTVTSNDTDPIETTDPFTSESGFVTGTSISSWYLNRIESADSVFSINLIYTPEEYGVFNLSTFPLANGTNSNMNELYGIKCVKNIIHGVRLQSILFSNGQATFDSGSVRQDLSTAQQLMDSDTGSHTARTLDKISISTADGYCHSFKFDYEYFEDNITPLSTAIPYSILSDKKRLKLKQIQESSCNNSVVIPPYIFEYFTEQVPRRLSCGQDHWGFYNGITTNNGLIPTYTLNNYTTVTRANRDSYWPAMRCGSLKKIQYPTGGSTELAFEANTTWVNYTKYDSNFISTITSGYDGNQTTHYYSVTFSQAVHKIRFTNSTGGGNATLIAPGGTLTAAAGETVEQIQTFSPGTYSIQIGKSTATSGHGCSADLYDMVPVQVQENRIVGGLRIKTITKKDTVTSRDQVSNFSYDDASQISTGILYSKPTYIKYLRNDLVGQVGYGGSYPNGIESPYGCVGTGVYSVSPGSLRPLATTQGSHIGYNEVKVSNSGNGYSIYRYYGSNFWDNIQGDIAVRNLVSAACSFDIPNHPEAPLAIEYKRGEIKHESHFTESNQLVRSVDYYPVYEENKLVTPCVLTSMLGGSRNITFYDLKTSRKTELKTIEYVAGLSQTGLQTTTTAYYESPFHNQITNQVITNSKGDSIKTKYKYSKDFALSCDLVSDSNQAYLNNAAAYKSQFELALLSCSDSWCRRIQLHYYEQNMHQARLSYINYRKTQFTNSNSQLVVCRDSAKSLADANLKPIIELQNQNNVTPIETTVWKNGNLMSASFNKYDYVSDPAGKINLSKTQTIDLNIPSPVFTNGAVNGNGIQKDSRYTEYQSIVYRKGNIVQVIKRDGITISYLWGYKKAYPVAQITGANDSTINALVNQSILDNPSSDAALRNHLDSLRINLPNALITSYTYRPLVGITSQTDPNGRVTYYEYDVLGRLKLIRDQYQNILKTFDYQYQQSQ